MDGDCALYVPCSLVQLARVVVCVLVLVDVVCVAFCHQTFLEISRTRQSRPSLVLHKSQQVHVLHVALALS